jgi:hypothetical protein
MAVFNSADYLAEAIDSILAQSYTDFEFIIVDDGSTDGSVQILQQYARSDARIRPLLLSHRGLGGALNAGVAVARGKLLARMDSDDVALPERFATQIAWMHETGVDICGSCIRTFGAERRVMWFPESHQAVCNELVFRCALMHPTVMMRAEIAKEHTYNESLYFEDYELWTRLAPLYRMGNVPQILLKYRVHPKQLHVTRAAEVRSVLKTYSHRFFLSKFPEATVEDLAVIRTLVLNEPVESLAALERSAILLAQLADCNDRYVRTRMAQRWWGACRRSAYLGLGTFRVHRKFNALFGMEPSPLNTSWLLVACFFRLHADSQLEKLLRKIRRRFFV